MSSLRKFLSSHSVQSSDAYTHANMDGGLYYIPNSQEKRFLDEWERAVEAGETYSITRLLDGLKIDGVYVKGRCTLVVDLDGYPSIDILQKVKTRLIELSKEYFIIKTSDITTYTHQNSSNSTKVHLYLLVDNSPVTVSFALYKIILSTLRKEFNPHPQKNWIDDKIKSLRLPGAVKKGGEATFYPLENPTDSTTWRNLCFYYSKNPILEINRDAYQTYLYSVALEEKTKDKNKTTISSKIVLNEAQISEILSEETQKFILDNIKNKVFELDFNAMISLYSLMVSGDAWNRGVDELKEIVSEVKNCSGDCVKKIDKAVQSNPSKYILSPQEAFFRLRKKILQNKGDMKLCPVFSVKTYTYEDKSVSQSFVVGCLMNEELGLQELYYKIMKNDFVAISKEVDGKNVVGYIWRDFLKLWEPVTFKMLQTNVSVVLSHVVKQHLSSLEKDFLTKEKDEQPAFKLIIASVKKSLSNLQKHAGVSGIANFVLTNRFFINAEFLEKVNMSQYIIPLKNTKCIDLKSVESTGSYTIRERTKEDYFTCTFGVDKVGDPTNSTFQKYIQQFQPDPIICNYLKLVIGAALLGIYGKKTFFAYFLGPKGNNGKTVFFNLLRDVLSSNFFTPCDDSSLITIDENSIKKDARRQYAALTGKRVGYFPELDSNKVLDSRIIKQIAGGEQVGNALLFENTQMKDISYRMFICSNNFPTFTECDEATLGRTLIIPCFTLFGDSSECDYPKDDRLISSIKLNHIPDFFAWCLEGAVEYIKAGEKFPIIEQLEKLKNMHAKDEDPYSIYFDNENYCKFGPNETCDKAKMFKNFKLFLFKNDYSNFKTSPQKFMQALNKKYPKLEVYKNKTLHYRGVSFHYIPPKLTDEEEEQEALFTRD
jgi:hypothetical protein